MLKIGVIKRQKAALLQKTTWQFIGNKMLKTKVIKNRKFTAEIASVKKEMFDFRSFV